MPTLMPTADENLHPNQWQYETPAPIKNDRPALSILRSGNSIQQRPRFRENAPHLSGKRVSFRTSATIKRKSPHGGLLHLAQIYNPKPSNNISTFQRQYIHSTHAETKQSIAYSNYINHLISPHVMAHDAMSPRDSFSRLLLHQARSSELAAAHSLYSKMYSVRCAIDREVGRGRLIMRSDRDMNELLLRQELMGVLMSYNVRWLGLGLGVVLDERGMGWEMANKHTLEKIILERILSDPAAQRKYTGGRVKTPSGKYEVKLREFIHHHALTKMLALVTYLDMAKRAQILNDDPCLFDKESQFKSSNAVLSSICRICFARKELINHLAHLGITVSHVQNPLDEYEYYIKNLSIDLKDGVRLAKMMEILTGRLILNKMRLPAVSRSNKIHNVGEVLSALHEEGVPNIDDVTAAHIVDAHQPRILQLLWSAIVHFQLGGLDGSVIEEEIRCVERWAEQKKSGGASNEYHGVNKTNASVVKSLGSSPKNIQMLLLTWCQKVCSFYGVSVDNFADSFSDGKVLCLLVSFYHPTLLNVRDILPTAADMQAKLRPGVKMEGQLVRMALQNERYNLSLALSRMDELGGMPRLFSSKEFLLPPDERSTVLCVSYLFTRLTETNREFAAAREIQQWWHRSLTEKKRVAAAVIMAQWRQRKDGYFRNQRLMFASSVRVIEAFYARHECKFKELARITTARMKYEKSVVRIQSIVRSALALKLYKRKLIRHRAAILMQAQFRRVLAQKTAQYQAMHKACVVIQKNWRARFIKAAYKFVLRGVTSIQSLARSRSCHSQYQSTLAKIIVLQSLARRSLVHVRFSKAVSNNFEIRSFFRRFLLWKHGGGGCRDGTDEERVQALFSLVEARGMMNLQAVRFHSALYIQSIYRGHVTRQNNEIMNLAATHMQRIVRRHLAQISFGFHLMDIIAAQSIARRYIAQVTLQKKHDKATIIGRIWRGYQAKLSYGFCLMNIMMIQSIARKFLAKKHFTKMQAAVQIERTWRGYHARCCCGNVLISVTKIQSVWRGYLRRDAFLKQRNAVLIIQTVHRQRLATKLLVRAVQSATKIQSFVRANRDRRCVDRIQACAVRVQTYARLFIARNSFQRLQIDAAVTEAKLASIHYRCATITLQRFCRQYVLSSVCCHATTIQRFWRGYSDRCNYQRTLTNVAVLQSHAGKSKIKSHHDKDVAPLEICQTSNLDQPEQSHGLSEQNPSLSVSSPSTTKEFVSETGSDLEFNPYEAQDDAFEYVNYTSHQRTCRQSCEFEVAVRQHSIRSPETTAGKPENGFDPEQQHSHQPLVESPSVQPIIESKKAASSVPDRGQSTILADSIDDNDSPMENSQTHNTSNEKENKSPATTKQIHPSSGMFNSTQDDLERLLRLRSPLSSANSTESCQAKGAKSPKITPPFGKTRSDARHDILHNNPSVAQPNTLNASRSTSSPMAESIDIKASRSSVDCKATGMQNPHRSPRESIEIQSTGVQTRSKASIFRSLNAAKPKESKIFRNQLLSPSDNSSVHEPKNKTPSPELERTIKAIEVVERSRLMSELKEAINILEETTRKSKESCKYFARAKCQIMLCVLISSCNRSTPHVELMRMILQTLTNVAAHRSAAHRLASKEVIEVIIYVCQMYRDKSKLLALSCPLLDRVLMNADRDIMAIYSSQEQKMKLHGILSLCKKRISLGNGNDKYLRKGITSLEDVVAKMEQCLDGERVLSTIPLR